MPDEQGHPSPEEMRLGTVMAALADPLRARVIAELAADESDPERTCASFELGVAKSTVTHHFRVLRRPAWSARSTTGPPARCDCAEPTSSNASPDSWT